MKQFIAILILYMGVTLFKYLPDYWYYLGCIPIIIGLFWYADLEKTNGQ